MDINWCYACCRDFLLLLLLFFSCSLNHPKVKVPDQATDKLVLLLLLLLLPGNTTVNSGAVVGTTFLSLSTRGRYYIQVTREGGSSGTKSETVPGMGQAGPLDRFDINNVKHPYIYIYL